MPSSAPSIVPLDPVLTQAGQVNLYPLPGGIRSRWAHGINGMRMHYLEAGYADHDLTARRPCLLLLHGFPELSYSWRKVMLPLAEAGYHVIAPDLRGYGGTTGWDSAYDTDLSPFHMLGLVRDLLHLVAALGRTQIEAVIGHDFGSPLAGWCALTRPDVFRAVALMSAPFTGSPALPHRSDAGNAAAESAFEASARLLRSLESLTPPRLHYQVYYATREANAEMLHYPQGLPAFLRAYYHMKSADWAPNRPHPLAAASAAAMAELPTYYVMQRSETMAQTVAPHLPSVEQQADCQWLSPADLAVYADSFARTGFQGGLNWYRCSLDRRSVEALQLFAGRGVDVPACFMAGERDWGTYQSPGAFEKMQTVTCSNWCGTQIIPGAGHWVQQEQPQAVVQHLLAFLRSLH